MIDLEDYEKNKGQRCLDKWNKIPMVNEAMKNLDVEKQKELSVKLEDNRISFFKNGTDKFVENMMNFIQTNV